MGSIMSQITSLTIIYSIVYSDADQRKHQSSASLAFVRGIHRGPVNSPHKWPVTRRMFPFDAVIMRWNGHHVNVSIPFMQNAVFFSVRRAKRERLNHYDDVICAPWRPQPQAIQPFAQPFFRRTSNISLKLHVTGPLISTAHTVKNNVWY